jgi:hypothetical protein
MREAMNILTEGVGMGNNTHGERERERERERENVVCKQVTTRGGLWEFYFSSQAGGGF